MTLPERIYALVLHAYPPGYRRAHRRELLGTLQDVLGAPPRLRAREVLGLLVGGLGQRLSATRRLDDRQVRATALVVLVLGLISSLWHQAQWPGSVPAGAGPASFAPASPAYSHRTSDVRTAPLGRAVALYQQGTGVEWRDYPQALVLAADGTATRRLSLALDRAGSGAQGDPAPMLLSADGRHVAVGAYDQTRDDLVILDLSDGAVDEVPVPAGEEIRPLAWSPDGRRLAITAGKALLMVDLRSGTASRLPQGDGAVGAAFSPVSDDLAVLTATLTVTDTGIGSFTSPRLQVLAADGTLQRTLQLRSFDRPLGSNAWSPDGRLLALDAPGDRVAFVRTDGSGDAPPTLDVPHPGEGYHGYFAGWSSAERLVLATGPGTGGVRGDATLVETGLAGQDERVLTTISTNDGNEAVWRMQLASALLPRHFPRPQSESDTGPWSLPYTAGLSVAAALASWVLVQLLDDLLAAARRRQQRQTELHRQSSASTALS